MLSKRIKILKIIVLFPVASAIPVHLVVNPTHGVEKLLLWRVSNRELLAKLTQQSAILGLILSLGHLLRFMFEKAEHTQRCLT